MTLRRKKRDQGFTLMELMVVIVILGLLVSIVAMNFGKVTEDAKRGVAKTQMASIKQAIQTYKLQKNKLPDTLQDLVGEELIDSIPKDPWDGDYVYTRVDKRKFELKCLGADGTEGGDGPDEDFTLDPQEQK